MHQTKFAVLYADGGKSVIVKYLTSSKLTKLQLRDAAFRRTLLVQCLVLLHACEHPRHPTVGKPLPKLKEKQVRIMPNLLQSTCGSLLRMIKDSIVLCGLCHWI